jgi:hypothetical protein
MDRFGQVYFDFYTQNALRWLFFFKNWIYQKQAVSLAASSRCVHNNTFYNHSGWSLYATKHTQLLKLGGLNGSECNMVPAV